MTACAVTTDDNDLAKAMLERLEGFGADRRTILRLVLERVQGRGPSSIELAWVSRRLDTRSLWERDPGPKIVRELFGEGNGEGASAIIELCSEAARHKNADALLRIAHTVLAEILVSLARRAIGDRDLARARSALRAIVHLSPASRLRREVRTLPRQTDPELAQLVAVVEDLLRRSDHLDEPSLDGIRDALLELVREREGEE